MQYIQPDTILLLHDEHRELQKKKAPFRMTSLLSELNNTVNILEVCFISVFEVAAYT